MMELKDHWYVNLTVEEGGERRPLPLNRDVLQSLRVVSSIDMMVPTIMVGYRQPAPILQDRLPITGMEQLGVELAKSRKSGRKVVTERFRLMKSRPHTEAKGDPKSPMMVLRGFAEPFVGLGRSPTRALQGRPEEAVEEVVAPFADDVRTTETKAVLDGTYIQPGWKNGEMVEYLRSKSVSTKGLGPYKAWFTRPAPTPETDRRDQLGKGVFNFRSVDEMIRQPQVDGIQNVLVYAENFDKRKNTSPSDPAGGQRETPIADYDFKNDARTAANRGSLGARAVAYDWEEGEYVEADTVWQEEDYAVLTDRYVFGDEDNYVEDRPGGDDVPVSPAGSMGREAPGEKGYDGEVEDEARKRLVDGSLGNSVIELILRSRRPDIRAGDKVRVEVFDQSQFGNRKTVPAGRWLVHTKTEEAREEFVTRLKLVRSGVNEPTEFASRLSQAGERKVR